MQGSVQSGRLFSASCQLSAVSGGNCLKPIPFTNVIASWIVDKGDSGGPNVDCYLKWLILLPRLVTWCYWPWQHTLIAYAIIMMGRFSRSKIASVQMFILSICHPDAHWNGDDQLCNGGTVAAIISTVGKCGNCGKMCETLSLLVDGFNKIILTRVCRIFEKYNMNIRQFSSCLVCLTHFITSVFFL